MVRHPFCMVESHVFSIVWINLFGVNSPNNPPGEVANCGAEPLSRRRLKDQTMKQGHFEQVMSRVCLCIHYIYIHLHTHIYIYIYICIWYIYIYNIHKLGGVGWPRGGRLSWVKLIKRILFTVGNG